MESAATKRSAATARVRAAEGPRWNTNRPAQPAIDSHTPAPEDGIRVPEFEGAPHGGASIEAIEAVAS